MRFRNAVRLLMENFHNSYKILLYKFVVMTVGLALSCAFLLPELIEIAESSQFRELSNSVKAFFDVLISGTDLNVFVENMHEALTAFLIYLSGMSGELIFAAIGCLLVYLLERFADSVCYFTIGSVLNDRMDTYAETPFWSAFVRMFGKSTKYSLVYIPLAFVWDALTIAACYFFFFYLSSFSNLIVSMGLSITLIAVCQSLKLTVTSVWMPAMTSDKLKINQAMKCLDKTERKQSAKVFSVYLVSIYLIITVNVLAAITTFGSALLITIPTSFLLLICIQYVNYYVLKGKKYFVTFEEIEKDVSCGDSTHYFDYVLEESAEEQPQAVEETPQADDEQPQTENNE